MKANYLVLDANVIYSYFGREKLKLHSTLDINKKRLDRLLDKSFLFISSSVLAEILVHFRKDLNIVRELVLFLNRKEFYVMTASTDLASEKTIEAIITSQNDLIRKNVLDGVLNSKVKLEIYVVYVFAGIISSIIGGLLIEDAICSNHSALSADTYSKAAMDNIVKNREHDLAIGESELIRYYNLDKDSVGMKKIYDDFLIKDFKAFENELLNLERALHPKKEIDEDSFFNNIGLSATPEKLYINIARMVSNFKKKKTYKNTIMKKIETITTEWKYFDDWQKKYLSERFEYYLNNVKFRKNDVFDTLFLGTFKDESIAEINSSGRRKGVEKCSRNNYHLLSFDETVSRFIYKYDWKGALIADRIRNKRLFDDREPDKE